ncbi:TetR family transcriptional regulator [Modestobacter sp. I12A-02628]|uniref:TetR/AcrR family transcriptional regulator n=1 Tax=Goekera deserti TaxID=2497753 RepID=A0A7K3WDT2_9ACTN|nr:TetR/AcrR family transcriptional regulator [Goekera deserti]MPQ99562.1 TetR family transcriptional regulator [Goekera deserti]NDI46426.1 TetR family transcriptional regulator [Goekera deserti]NEL54641.1 TetR/AcrR family transcriptional regulator [Goekera deserti]
MPGSPDVHRLTRDDRRQRSEAAILAAARQQFADAGFERTTIRGVASAAGVDPALVMQHFGSKEALFAAATRMPDEPVWGPGTSAADVPRLAIEEVLDRFEDEEGRDTALALARNCLTHPSATTAVRDDVMCDRISTMAGVIGGDDAELRAAVLNACLMGVTIARYLLELPPLASASREDVTRLLEPALAALVTAPDAD